MFDHEFKNRSLKCISLPQITNLMTSSLQKIYFYCSLSARRVLGLSVRVVQPIWARARQSTWLSVRVTYRNSWWRHKCGYFPPKTLIFDLTKLHNRILNKKWSFRVSPRLHLSQHCTIIIKNFPVDLVTQRWNKK